MRPSTTLFIKILQAMAKPGFYAVKRGRVPGVYNTWAECQEQTDKFINPVFKKFPTFEEANAWAGLVSPARSAPPVASTSSSFYAVVIGRRPGVYSTWEECAEHTDRFPKAHYKRFSSQAQAEAYLSSGPSGFSVKRMRSSDSVQPGFPNKRASILPAAPPANKKTGPVEGPDGYTRLSSGRIVVYTDGSALGNGTATATAGAGVFWSWSSTGLNISRRVYGSEQTNNRGELLAILLALESAPDPWTPLEIKTDSDYSINALTKWLPGWRKRRFQTADSKPVKNLDLILHIERLLLAKRCDQFGDDYDKAVEWSRNRNPLMNPKIEIDVVSDAEPDEEEVKEKIVQTSKATRAKSSRGAVRFKWVKAHRGEMSNEMADKLAKAGAYMDLAEIVLYGQEELARLKEEKKSKGIK